MRGVAVGFVAALAIGCLHPSGNIATTVMPKAIAAEVISEKTVALVEPDDEERTGLRASCTGVWVGHDRILTAAHCTGDGGGLGLMLYVTKHDVFKPGSIAEEENVVPRPALVEKIDEAHDLALLRAVGAPPHSVAVVTSRVPYVGETAQEVGQSMGLWWSYSSGDVAALRWLDFGKGPAVYIQATTPTSPGNSGGGLFNADCELIGVADAVSTHGQNLSFFIYTDYIRQFIRGT